MMYCLGNQNKRFGNCAAAIASSPVKGVRCSGFPGVPFAVDDGEARVGDVVSAVFVYGLEVGARGNVEGELADETGVGEVGGAGDEGEAVFGGSVAGLEEL